ncbi:L10-interacting MYB domain-containing protein-like isoform X2 [Tripterygium wilfordii]|nr:L10-interacting MYB domain-containing protein-like isoform X2 [Tripterygium wilfordii]
MNVGEVQNEVDCEEIDEKDEVWSKQIENYLIELMVEEVKKGNRTTTTFSKSGWKAIKEGLKAKFDKDYNDVQLKNKYNQLRNRQKCFKALIKETGIGYNVITCQVNATNECWESLSKVHRMAKRFKKKGCKEFPALCIIFGDTTASGAHAHPSTKSPSHNEEESFGVDNSKDTSSRVNEEVEIITPESQK